MVKKIDTGGKNYGQNNPQNFVHNNDQYQIQDVHAVLNIGPNLHQGVNENMQNKLPNDQNYVTREEFVEFNESINERLDRIEQILKNKFKTNNERVTRMENKRGIEGKKKKKEKKENKKNINFYNYIIMLKKKLKKLQKNILFLR